MGSLTLEDLAEVIKSVGMDLKTDMEKLRQEIDAKLSSIDEKFTGVIGPIKSDIVNLSKRQDVLEAKVEELDRLSHSSDLMVNGIPFLEGEKLLDIYNHICTAIGYFAKDYTLISIFRLKNQKSRNPTIILKFISSQAKREFYICYLKYQKLSLIDVGFETNLRIYINESLTVANAEIFKAAMEHRKNGRLYKVYTQNGFVFVRQTSEAAHIKIDSLHHLNSSCESATSLNHKRKPSSEPEKNLTTSNDTKIFKSNNSKTSGKAHSTANIPSTPLGSNPKLNPFSRRTSAQPATTNGESSAKSENGKIDSFFEKLPNSTANTIQLDN